MTCPACRALLVGLALLGLTQIASAQRRTLYEPSPAGAPQQVPFQGKGDVATATAARADRNLSAEPRYSAPYVGGVSNYHINTAPTVVGGGYGGYGWPGYGFGYGYGAGYGNSSGGVLQGAASLTQAQGQYWNDIQQARIVREQSRQASIDTKRKQLEWELEYEKYRPTAPKLKAQEQATDIDWARNHAQKTEIWSGRTLNVLMQSILKSPSPTRGPYISLDDDQLKGINLTDGTTRANLSLAKDQGRIAWTEALQEEPFDESRDGFQKNFDAAIRQVESGQQPTAQMLRGLRADLKKLDEKLDDQVRDLAPSRYIESRRLLNQLKETVNGLANPRLVKSASKDWKKNVNTVADLVGYCMKNGLEFGPAVAPGDDACYTSLYYAMRSYERGVTAVAQR